MRNKAAQKKSVKSKKLKKTTKPTRKQIKKVRTQKKRHVVVFPDNPSLSLERYHELIVKNREHGKRLAWSFLTSWRIKMNPEEVDSIIGLALCEAASRFDESKKVAFRTFFFYHLRGRLLKEIAKMIQDQRVLRLLPPVSLCDVGDCDKDGLSSLPPALVDENNPEDIAGRREKASVCWNACAKLDSLEREVLIRYFVFDDSLVKISKDLKYCRCHISRVKSRALFRVASFLRNRHSSFPVSEKDWSDDFEKKVIPISKESVKSTYKGGRGRSSKRRSEELKANVLKYLSVQQGEGDFKLAGVA